MAASLDMFGPGGEALGGLFMGNQIAQQRDAAAAEQAKIAADIANTQAITQQRQLGNEYEGAILGDKIQAYKDAATQKREDAQIEKYGRQGEQFGRMSQELKAMPAVARTARLQQIAQQQGIGADNPMLQQFLQADPEQLPDLMEGFSKGFYEQSDKARAEKLKRDEMLKLEREKIAARAEEGAANREMRRDIASEASADRRFLGSLAAGSRERAAAAKGAGKGGPVDVLSMVASGKLTPDKAITYYEMKEAAEGGLSAEEQQAKENLQRYQLSKPTVGRPDTSGITGLPSAPQRVEAAVRGSKGAAPAASPQTKAPAAAGGDIAAAVKNTGQPYEPNKYEYQVTPDGRVLRKPKQAAVPK